MPNTATKHYAIDLQNPEGNTPLHIAAKRGVPGIVKICLQAGADFNIKNNQGQKASDIATGEVKQLLLNQELFHARIENNVLEVQRLMAEGANPYAYGGINTQDTDGNTDLHVATKNSDLGRVKILIRGGADFNIKNNEGQKPSDIATGEVKQLLLGQELNQAAAEGNLSELKKLIAEGADVSVNCISPVIDAHKGPGPVFFNATTINKNDDAATTPSVSNYSAK